MAITINTNVASLTAQASLSKATNRMNTAMERLSTGLRINSSKDDAAGSAVVTKLDYKTNSLNVAVDNAQMGSSLLDTAEGTLNVVQSNLERIRELTEQAANGTYGDDALEAIRSEIAGRLDEIDRIAASTEFNGKFLLDGSMDAGINLQVGIMADENSVIKLQGDLFAPATANGLLGDFEPGTEEVKFKTVEADWDNDPNSDKDDKVVFRVGDALYTKGTPVDGVTPLVEVKLGTTNAANEFTPYPDAKIKEILDAYDASTAEEANATKIEIPFVDKDNKKIEWTEGNIKADLANIFSSDRTAQQFLKNIDKGLEDVTARKTEIGAYQQRLASAMEVANVMSTNLTAASSLIKDADIAKESSDYIKNQILQQATTTLLATANQNPNIALNLL